MDAPDPDPRSDAGGDPAEHRVELVRLDGSEEVVAADPEETVVEVAEGAGVDLPYGCLYGACGTCTARVLEGELDYVASPRGLKPEARDRGFVLACIAVPATDCRLRVGHDLQAEAMGTPWK
jgi:ferredoxin